MRLVRFLAPAGAFVLMAGASATLSAQSGAKLNRFGNPEKLKPSPTAPTITPRDLQIRLYQFADDSMMGRQVGRVGNRKGTDFIAAELKRLGLVPGGVNGTYFQNLPFHLRQYTAHSRVTVDGTPVAWNSDIVGVPGQRAPRPVSGAEVVFGGTQGDTSLQIPASAAAGKFVVLLPAPGGRGGQGQAFAVRQGFAPPASRFADAAAVAVVDLDNLTAGQRVAINEPMVASQAAPARGGAANGNAGPADSITLLKRELAALQPQASFRLTRAGAQQLFKGQAIEALSPGARGGVVEASLDYVELPTDWARNVIGIIPGSDPKLRHQYVAVGAHNDHVGFTTPVDKDSLKAFNDIRNRMLLANNMEPLGPAQVAGIRVNMDSIRRVHPQPRLDSINNGADDDGSGTVTLIELAEACATAAREGFAPRRTMLFMAVVGEEKGLLGSEWYSEHPVWPLDFTVANLNIDMIGRTDAAHPDNERYVYLIGSDRLSTELHAVSETVNARFTQLALDYTFNAEDDPNRFYYRSDHYNFARKGVPVIFYFSGVHEDYHKPGDDAHKIRYGKMAEIGQLVFHTAWQLANQDRRIKVDRPEGAR
jgi:hypothetical protein